MSPAATPVVAVDGPGGAGKGSLCALLARALGYHLLDSGALYRLTALAAERRGIALDDPGALAATASGLTAEFRLGGGDPPVRVLLDGVPVDEEIRSERCGDRASRVAVVPAVREALLARQRAFRRPPGLVADGRDMGTVVFPDAVLKIFLTASAEERARRRYKQLIAKGISASLHDLLGEIEERDRRDRSRRAAPLRPAADAVVIDTSAVALDAVFARVMEIARSRGLAGDRAGEA